MSTIQDLLDERRLPALLEFADGRAVTRENFEERRKEILSILDREIYGTAPDAPKELRVTREKPEKKKYGNCAGKASYYDLSIAFDTDRGEFSFPAVEIIPKSKEKLPVVVLLNFCPDVPDRCFPAEEIVDDGVAVVRICYKDITDDANDCFSSGIAPMYDREKYTWGKIRMWAFAASRVMDYLETTDYADLSRVAVVGHSRLGKTALVTAAYDERFVLACSNDSGCAGSAITRGKGGEQISSITKNFPYWFCEKYKSYAGKTCELPFDQHFLIGAIAPRRVSIGSASEDLWADPVSEYLGAVAASEAWGLLGEEGFVHPDRLPEIGDRFLQGKISYHLRAGRHFLSRTDWRVYLDVLHSM